MFAVCVLAGILAAGNWANPDAVKDASSAAEANATWWGFDADDSTAFVQAAIDSGVKKVIVPYVGKDWIVGPIKLRGNLELVFDPGVVVMAKKNEFKGPGDSLFSAQNVGDVTLRGYGATLRMRKQDYQNEPYKKAEWRMALDFVGCSRVRVEGLRLESSGGDGIYLGANDKQPYCEDVTIRDVVCDDNHRQGISVISAVNLLIENCVMSNTSGTAPQAGIDLEPNKSNERLKNCVIRNCLMENNTGAGIAVHLSQFSHETEPLSILFENCYVHGGKNVGIAAGAIKDGGPQGVVEFRNCTVEGAEKGGLYLYDKSPTSARVRFADCTWNRVGLCDSAQKALAPPLFLHVSSSRAAKIGGIDFDNCRVYDDLDRPAIGLDNKNGAAADIRGTITVANPHGARADLGASSTEIGLIVK